MAEGPGQQTGTDQSVMTEQVSRQAQQVTQQAQQAAQQAVSGAQSALDGQREKGAQTLTQTAEALRKTSQDLSQNNVPVAGQAVEMAAGKLEDVAGYLRNRSVVQLIDDAERYARSNGPLVMGGAFVLGLLAARFLKSSPPQSGSNPGSYPPPGYSGYNTGSYDGGTGYQPYSYGETYSDAYQPGFEGSSYGLEPDISSVSPANEGTM